MKLHKAVAENNVWQVRALLEKRVNPNLVEDEALITPLHIAAQNNAIDIATLLILAGANINAETEEGETPLNIAHNYHYEELIALFKKVV